MWIATVYESVMVDMDGARATAVSVGPEGLAASELEGLLAQVYRAKLAKPVTWTEQEDGTRRAPLVAIDSE
jgi:hypothetical protein